MACASPVRSVKDAHPAPSFSPVEHDEPLREALTLLKNCSEKIEGLLEFTKDPTAAKLRPPRPWTRKEVSAHFGVTLRTIDNWCANGLLTPRKIGKRAVRFECADIEALLATTVVGRAGL